MQMLTFNPFASSAVEKRLKQAFAFLDRLETNGVLKDQAIAISPIHAPKEARARAV
jgi:hypothetical protein